MLNFKPCFCQKEWGSCQHFPKTVLEAKGPNKLKKAQQSAWKAGLNMWSSWTKWRECWQAMRLLQATWKSCSRDAHCRTQLLGSFWLERATEAAPVQSDKTGSPQITELSLKNQKHTRAECFFPYEAACFTWRLVAQPVAMFGTGNAFFSWGLAHAKAEKAQTAGAAFAV